MNNKTYLCRSYEPQEEKQGFFMAEGVLDVMAQQDFGIF